MYNWCHGPECHERVTQDRVRGNKGNKVLRTRKIRETNWNKNTVWSNFCSQGCWNDFMNKHWNEFIRLHPRTEALETPIEDPKKVERTYGWSGQKYYTTEINKKTVDNNNSNDRIIP
jgi:hypothetical protein